MSAWPDDLLENLAQFLRMDDLADQTAWFDKHTNNIVLICYDPESDWQSPPSDDSPEWQRRDRALGEAIVAAPEQYIRIEGTGTPGRLHDFLRTIEDPGLREALDDAKTGGRGAYRRVRSVLHRRGLEQLWYDFEAAADREMATDWLARHQLTPPTS